VCLCYRLCFHKRSDDGSGKCNIIETGSQQDRVYGVVYEISKEQLEKLDVAEGYGKGYVHKYIPLPNRPDENALAYVAGPKYIDDELSPYRWYHGLIIAGAEQHGLPVNYIEELRRQGSRRSSLPKAATRF
jgi:gamma-glutamylcyclotransferase